MDPRAVLNRHVEISSSAAPHVVLYPLHLNEQEVLTRCSRRWMGLVLELTWPIFSPLERCRFLLLCFEGVLWVSPEDQGELKVCNPASQQDCRVPSAPPEESKQQEFCQGTSDACVPFNQVWLRARACGGTPVRARWISGRVAGEKLLGETAEEQMQDEIISRILPECGKSEQSVQICVNTIRCRKEMWFLTSTFEARVTDTGGYITRVYL